MIIDYNKNKKPIRTHNLHLFNESILYYIIIVESIIILIYLVNHM